MTHHLSRLRAVCDRLENSLISDAIGVALLFGLLYLVLSFGCRP
jgi:hypothetical protein